MNNDKTEVCPLTPAMVVLLQTAAAHGAATDRELAELLSVTPSTIHTQFGRICGRLGVHDRAAALLVAVRYGWIMIPPPPGPWKPPEAEK